MRRVALGANTKKSADAQTDHRRREDGDQPALAARLAHDGGEGEALAFLGLLEGEALQAAVAGVADDVGEHVVRQLHALGADPIFNPQQPARDQRVDERLRDARLLERGFEGEVVAKTGLRQQLVLDEGPHAG
ncbi:MAG: hypothetical protein EXS37_21440, partial [Opitutus sp.]|nr:hypothetical protein [Opitutus sp.]